MILGDISLPFPGMGIKSYYLQGSSFNKEEGEINFHSWIKKKSFDMLSTQNFDSDDMVLHREKLSKGKRWSPEILSNFDNLEVF